MRQFFLKKYMAFSKLMDSSKFKSEEELLIKAKAFCCNIGDLVHYTIVAVEILLKRAFISSCSETLTFSQDV